MEEKPTQLDYATPKPPIRARAVFAGIVSGLFAGMSIIVGLIGLGIAIVTFVEGMGLYAFLCFLFAILMISLGIGLIRVTNRVLRQEAQRETTGESEVTRNS